MIEERTHAKGNMFPLNLGLNVSPRGIRGGDDREGERNK